MKKPIFYLVKVFEKKEYAEDFIKGKLFLNRVSYFKKIEDKENRGDKHEATDAWLQPANSKITIGNIEIKSEDIALPVSIQHEHHNNLHLFCLYAAYTDKFQNISEKNFEEFKKEIEINEECLALGNYAVIILNSKLFLKRFVSSVQKYNYTGKGQLVKYYNPKTFHGFFKEDPVFYKQTQYAYQKEFRFSIDTGTIGEDHIIMDLGDLSDITCISSPNEINRLLKINFSDETELNV